MAHILIIDDEDLIRATFRQVLERMGHSVCEAENGALGLALCTNQDIDLVITDIHMPVVNGLETIATLRRWGVNTPILAVSGGAGGRSCLDSLALALLQGANLALAKPCDAAELRAAVTRLLAYSLCSQVRTQAGGEAAAELPPERGSQRGN